MSVSKTIANNITTKLQRPEADSSPSISNNKKEEANKSNGANQPGESAIKKALLGKRPMNLIVGGEAVSLVYFAVANDCDEKFLSSLNLNKLEIPILTEEEKNLKLGKAIISIAGLLWVPIPRFNKLQGQNEGTPQCRNLQFHQTTFHQVPHINLLPWNFTRNSMEISTHHHLET